MSCITFQVNSSFLQNMGEEQPHSIQDLLSVLRKTTSKDEAYKRLTAYVLGANYPNELFCLYEADPHAPEDVFLRRAFHVLADANAIELGEIEELTREEGWLTPYVDIGEIYGWFFGQLYCYEERVMNVCMS